MRDFKLLNVKSMGYRRFRLSPLTILLFISIILTGCREATTLPAGDTRLAAVSANADDFLIVDCLLPGQIRKMGSQLTFLTARRAVRTSGSDCEIRGGEYVAFDRANYATALKIWLPLAQEGNAEAQTHVGQIFEKGLGQHADYQMAVNWYSKAAKQGYSRAQINLGHLYEKGLGVKQDKKRALDLYRLASGLKNDKLLYASTLSASYVPRSDYQALERDLELHRQKNAELQNELNKNRKQFAANAKRQQSNEQRLRQQLAKVKALGASVAASPAAAPTDNRVSRREKALQQQLDNLLAERANLKNQLKSLGTQSKLTRQDKEEINRSLQASRKEAKENKIQLAEAQREVDKNRELLTNSKREIEKLQAEIALQKSLNRSAEQQQKVDRLLAELDKRQLAHQQKIDDFNDLQRINKELSRELAETNLRIQQQQALAQQQADASLGETAKLQFLLDNKESQLKAVEEKLLVNQATLEVAHLAYLKSVEQLTEEGEKRFEESQREIEQLAESLESSRSQRLAQEQQINQLKWEIESFKDQEPVLASTGAAEQPAALGEVPSIEIIDPPVVLTRSVPTVQLRTKLPEREVIGKVTAPAGVLSFSVNGKKYNLAGNNLFRVSVPLGQDKNPVDIVAIDQAGRRVALNFSIINPQPGNSVAKSSVAPVADTSGLNLGRYFALVIGNNNYANLSTLKTAITDAKDTERVLRTKYGFRTKLLIDADRYQILSAMNELRTTLKENDNLLIYYAGHGKLDNANNRSYWLPVEAETDNSANWISSSSITDMLNAMAAKHVIVVADSCYAGSMTQTSVARVEEELPPEIRKEWMQAMADTRARVMLTSGGVQPVLDGGGGKNSVFAKAFIKALQSNDQIMEGFNLYSQILDNVPGQAAQLGESQIPQYAPIHLAGHEAGEFFFRPVL
ncbi:caspase family protein [Motiliproteus sp. MSK22-1]|uniref:caspase family protein n=1 Tax=Motiliproteus sp. MSK22-1 TaxID=1897630 RepID=UPI00097745C0|nr:caspase family protein [Motiliproteus sp. MSK22-1]OMH39190.1 hypothetical protein BGP75_05715 [Motiliproteus sp. MSK22-1]